MTDQTTAPLSPAEATELERHERAIDDALAAWLPKALALAAINADRLYRSSYPSFNDYVESRWGIKRRRAYQLIEAAGVASRLTAAGLPAPRSERHVRPLVALDVDDAVAVWRSVVEAAGDPSSVTGPAVEDAVGVLEASGEEGAGESDDARRRGRPVLSASAEASLDSAPESTATPKKPAPREPLVSVPPSDGHETADGLPASGPVLVPSTDVGGPLDGSTIAGLRDRFVEHYEEAGKRGPVLNRTNDHVGWAAWTLNPLTGCTWTCPFCYAREIANLRYVQGFVPTVHPERLLAPANTRVPSKHEGDPAARRVFLMSQADWMDPSFPDPVVEAVLDMCRSNPEWEFMTLTKQPQRLADFDYPDNVWVGVTVTRQGQVAGMERAFGAVDAAVRWVSFEPLHGPVALERPELVDLYVIGAERKTAQREAVKPTEAAWVDALRMQARSAGAAIWEKENLDVRLREMPEPRRRA